jgi:hypothetical protein
MVNSHRVLAIGLLATGLTCSALHPDELIKNGNFEQGNKEFRTTYKHTPGDITNELTYDIVTDPRLSSQYATSIGDHTNGKGNMLALNGGNAVDKELWGQSVAVKPGSSYRFSLHLASWYESAPAQLDIQINGKSIGKITASNKCGEWKEFTGRWNAGTDDVAVIRIVNLTTNISGNDFAIDDISLQGPPADKGRAANRASGLFQSSPIPCFGAPLARKQTVWQGVLHLGDNPNAYPKFTSAGMSFQVPMKLDPEQVARLTITATEVQTQAGKGHLVEVIAHVEDQPDKAPAREILVDAFRIKDKTTGDAVYSFEFNPVKNLKGMVPAYYSVRLKVDSYVQYSLWDDFLIKRIELEQGYADME